MSAKLDFGCVWINTHIPYVAEMPHGGFKHSGHGKDLCPARSPTCMASLDRPRRAAAVGGHAPEHRRFGGWPADVGQTVPRARQNPSVG